ncbi:MAG: transcription elongation factor GreA [Proteobacteria bacterium]|nr:transcription elongation factor GreA [Pseudomonadota bacterium]MCH8336748.1 transcription elongation factor GreA [Pseudomonadota bacterium]
MSKVPMTVRGVEMLREELKTLKSDDRPKVIQAIAEARAHGDLKENAEYHAAKDQQGFIEGRIKEIEAKLSNAQIIDVTAIDAKGKIVFGSTVDLLDVQSDQQSTYKIVGEDEADINEGLISFSSPIARAMMGKNEGDEVSFSAPGGEKQYEVIKVRYDV